MHCMGCPSHVGRPRVARRVARSRLRKWELAEAGGSLSGMAYFSDPRNNMCSRKCARPGMSAGSHHDPALMSIAHAPCEPRPVGDMAAASPVPVQKWGLSPVPAQMWRRRAQFRCRCVQTKQILGCNKSSPDPVVTHPSETPSLGGSGVLKKDRGRRRKALCINNVTISTHAGHSGNTIKAISVPWSGVCVRGWRGGGGGRRCRLGVMDEENLRGAKAVRALCAYVSGRIRGCVDAFEGACEAPRWSC
jgi:hypothetical protein